MTFGIRIAPAATADLASVAQLAKTLGHDALLIVGDDFVSGLDAAQVTAWLAPQVPHLRLVEEVPVTHNEPFHASSITATIDYASQGNSSWAPRVQTSQAAAQLVGRRPAADAEAAWTEASQINQALKKLWNSWEAEAIIRDQSTGRFIDVDKIHYVDFEGRDSVGEPFTIKGPSIVPRPPQEGGIPTTILVEDTVSAQAAVDFGEIVIVSEPVLGSFDATVLEALEDKELYLLLDQQAISSVGDADQLLTRVKKTSGLRFVDVIVNISDTVSALAVFEAH